MDFFGHCFQKYRYTESKAVHFLGQLAFTNMDTVGRRHGSNGDLATTDTSLDFARC